MPPMTSTLPAAARGKATAGAAARGSRLDHVHSNIGLMQRLFTLAAANMNSTADQSFVRDWDFDEYEISLIRCRDASLSLTTAVGGIYLAASKTTPIVANSQAYSGITGVGQGIDLTIAAAGRALLTATPILSLTTPQGAAATAVLEIWGIPLSDAD